MSTIENQPLGILVVGHGSPRAQANEGFLALVGRVAARLGESATVLPTFFSIAKPGIEDQVAALAARGVRRIVLMPYFLYTGQHVARDIPGRLAECRVKYPHIHIEVLPTLENEPALEDVLVDRLAPYLDDGRPLPSDGRAIERRSYEIIDARLKDAEPSDPASRAIIRRIIHATADFSFARTLRIHPQAVERGTSALAAGRPVICDVAMLQAAVTKVRGEVLCAISDPAAIRAAQEQVCTRAAAAMEHLAARLEGAIVAIGNAPTALWKIMEIVRRGGPKPALVAGLPVGFVGARESKLALIESGLCYITNTNARGGSPAAAAAVNALAITAEEWRNKDE